MKVPKLNDFILVLFSLKNTLNKLKMSTQLFTNHNK